MRQFKQNYITETNLIEVNKRKNLRIAEQRNILVVKPIILKVSGAFLKVSDNEKFPLQDIRWIYTVFVVGSLVLTEK